MGHRCTAEHSKLASTPSLWLSLHSIGIQPGYDEDGERDASEDLSLRNCACGSTLAVPAAVENRWIELDQDEPKTVRMMPLDGTDMGGDVSRRKNMHPQTETVVVTCAACGAERDVSTHNAAAAAKRTRCRFCVNRKHGLTNSPTYLTWKSMLARCENPKATGYKNYGGRGVVVCERWFDFQKFLDDMGVRPRGKTLDRIDVDGNYEPSNCRWATSMTQMRNRKWNKLTTETAREIRRLCGAGMSYSRAAARFGCSPANICLVVTGKTWAE